MLRRRSESGTQVAGILLNDRVVAAAGFIADVAEAAGDFQEVATTA
jgi:preprotein translocase subunit YajC